MLQFYYTLSGTSAFREEPYDNTYFTGLLLPAVVLDVKEELVKVKFDMDILQPPESAYWYPWQPDMGNLAYCMPEKGECVYVQIGNAAGGEDKAVPKSIIGSTPVKELTSNIEKQLEGCQVKRLKAGVWKN